MHGDTVFFFYIYKYWYFIEKRVCCVHDYEQKNNLKELQRIMHSNWVKFWNPYRKWQLVGTPIFKFYRSSPKQVFTGSVQWKRKLSKKGSYLYFHTQLLLSRGHQGQCIHYHQPICIEEEINISVKS